VFVFNSVNLKLTAFLLKVWLAVWLSIALFGPALHIISKSTSLGECQWKTLAIILKQSEEKFKIDNLFKML
jgi:hypothetical protein